MRIILGTPGAGKTTQTRLLAERLNCPWFSMGELIRQHATGEDRAQMLEGKIMADEPTLRILAKALEPMDLAKSQCIVEGSPRSIPQSDWWLEKINSGQVKLTGIILLSVSEEAAKARLEKRGRLDDHNEEVIHKRFAEYHKSITPTLEYLKNKGLTVHEVDASGGVEEIAKHIQSALGLKNAT